MIAKLRHFGFAMVALAASAAPALAAQPTPWQTGLQPAATNIMAEIRWFEGYTLWFIIPITLFVMGLLAWCVIRYNKKANPVPSRTSHNTLIEIIWTAGPVVILLMLAIPSFQLLTAQYTPPSEPEMTIKATGYQWYWGYEYQDDEGDPLSFDAILVNTDADRETLGKTDLAQYPRLLVTDNEVVVPINTTVRLISTSADVLHSWAMPAFGVKMDAVPGRLNETWFHVETPGLYYGQCSELCGKDHAYMPIAIRAVEKDQYQAWYEAAKSDLPGANQALVAQIEASRQVAQADK